MKEISYQKTSDLLQDAKSIIDSSRDFAYSSVNFAIIRWNWLLGKRISEEELNGEDRADYGKQVIKNLAEALSELYGSGFDASNLYKYQDFYKTFPILDTLRLKSFSRLSWSHYRTFLQVESKEARDWYMKEAQKQILYGQHGLAEEGNS